MNGARRWPSGELMASKVAERELVERARAASPGATMITIPLQAAPRVISESMAVTLRAHGLSLSPEILQELGNNTAQALMVLDENPANVDTDPEEV